MNKHIVRGCVLAGVLAICYGALAQTTGPRMPPLTIPSLAGRDLFEFYCATCHGRDGSGMGQSPRRSKSPPPDLTRLARDNGGAFPHERVAAFYPGTTCARAGAWDVGHAGLGTGISRARSIRYLGQGANRQRRGLHRVAANEVNHPTTDQEPPRTDASRRGCERTSSLRCLCPFPL